MSRSRCSWLWVLVAALVLPAAVRADTVTLKTGQVIEGKIEKVEADKLVIRTSEGAAEYSRDQVKVFAILQAGPEGKMVLEERTFTPDPGKMPFQFETEHYVIRTDTGEHVCRNAGLAMEELYAAYMAMFRPEEVSKKKVEIVIWEDPSKFRAYAESVKVKLPAGALGCFRSGPDGAQILTYKRRTDEFNTLSTLYHEGTHQFIMMVMGKHDVPLWVNEGLAVYFENSQWQQGKLKTGVIPRQRLMVLQKALRSDKHVPLADLLRRGRDTYDALCYSEGWSLVYFFAKANHGAYGERFMTYFRMLKDGKDPMESFHKCFSTDLDKLEQTWKKFILELEVPPEG